MALLEMSPGNTLAYELIEPSDAGFTFVFFNALSGDKSMWTSTVGAALTTAGHGMLLYNLRSRSRWASCRCPTDRTAFIGDSRALPGPVRPPRPIHVGLSIGGLFALEAHFAGGSGRADAIVLINTLRKPGPRLDWINDAVVRAAEIGGFDLMKDLYSPLLMNRDWQAENRPQFLKSEPYTPCAPDDRALMLLKSGTTADWNVDYERVDVPVLSITGLQDRVFLDRDDVRELVARIPDCRTIDMADAAHMLPVERPAALSQALVEFARFVGRS